MSDCSLMVSLTHYIAGESVIKRVCRSFLLLMVVYTLNNHVFD
jgi:hypothetical protein